MIGETVQSTVEYCGYVRNVCYVDPNGKRGIVCFGCLLGVVDELEIEQSYKQRRNWVYFLSAHTHTGAAFYVTITLNRQIDEVDSSEICRSMVREWIESKLPEGAHCPALGETM